MRPKPWYYSILERYRGFSRPHSHERIIDSDDKDISRGFEVFVFDVARDVRIAARRA